MAVLLTLLALVGGGAATTVTQSPYALGWKLSTTAVKSTQMVDLTIVVQVTEIPPGRHPHPPLPRTSVETLFRDFCTSFVEVLLLNEACYTAY